jgi:hypothetical protein
MNSDVLYLPKLRWLVLAGALFQLLLFQHAFGGVHVRTLLLWNEHAAGVDSLDQLSFESTLASIGFDPNRIPPSALSSACLDSRTLLVIPERTGASLTAHDVERIAFSFREGLNLIVDGESPLLNALGVRLGTPIRVSEITDHLRPDLQPFWSDTPAVAWLERYPKESSTIVYTDRQSGKVLGIVGRIGKGQFLCLAPLFDPRTGNGYGRFASFPNVVVDLLGCRPSLFRRGADAYFDAGYRMGVTPESLATLWQRWGIRAVHAAAWYSYNTPAYDYKALIDALHRKGILVYAWLEWPYIGKGFWDRHPAWRQKNALLRDAHLDFLYLMDLQNPECMGEALHDLKSFLALDWDGIDVAEFTLTGAGSEALAGPARPDYFAGFSEFSRKDFKNRRGFDPVELFDPGSPHFWSRDTMGLNLFYRYRVDVNREIQRTLFRELRSIEREQEKSWELILTIVDNSLHPEFDVLLGFSLKETVSLIKEFNVTLHIEDPYTEWTRPPDRYTTMGEYYRRLLGDRSFMIDINIVPMKPDRGRNFSTWQAVGAEFLHLWRYAAEQTERVCLYSESSVYPEDWKLLPFAMAARARAKEESSGWGIDAPYTVVLSGLDTRLGVLVDDRPWPACSDSEVIVPAGEHRVRGADATNDRLDERIRLRSIGGELLSAEWQGRELVLEYRSQSRCAVEFSTAPARVLVDGAPSALSTYRAPGACVVLAPPGKHRLVVSTE